MATFAVFTRLEAPKFAKLLLWLFDLPVRGVHIGGGIHVPMPDVAPNPCPLVLPGWATRYCNWIAKPSNTGADTDVFAVRVTPELADRWQEKKSQLTAQQRTFVQSHLDSAADLAAEWKRDILGTPTLFESDDVEPEP